jgi:hypothetical protein
MVRSEDAMTTVGPNLWLQATTVELPRFMLKALKVSLKMWFKNCALKVMDSVGLTLRCSGPCVSVSVDVPVPDRYLASL